MKKILIIEDEPDIVESLVYNFRRAGYRPVIAERGEAGLRLALEENDPPALIMLDVMLPGMGGLELCRRFRREPRTAGTPIVMLSAKASARDQAAGFEVGADEYITKPFLVKDVVARIEKLLGGREERPAAAAAVMGRRTA